VRKSYLYIYFCGGQVVWRSHTVFLSWNMTVRSANSGWSLHICAAGLDSLTARAREVMELVVSGQLNTQIAADVGASELTITRHRAQILQKMGAESLTEMVRTADTLGISSTTYVPEYPTVS
jgi:DNA-binding NarL/FixJ family response regulator